MKEYKKLHTVISDIDGKTGLQIIQAIFNGERNTENLADRYDRRIKAPREEIVKSLIKDRDKST